MNINQQAALKAGGIGAGVAAVISLITNGGSLVAPTVFGFISIICCCFSILVYAGVGALYGHFAKQEGEAVDTGSFALGGAIGGAAAAIVGSIVGGIISVIGAIAGIAPSVSQVMSPEMLQMYDDMGVNPSMFAAATSPGAAIGSAVLGICVGLFVGAALGAIGGAIYGATQKDSPPPAAEAPAV